MPKFKMLFIIAAIAIAICSAFASRPRACSDEQQYVKWGSVYIPVGVYGLDWHCAGSAGICTYFRPWPDQPNAYVPCHQGAFRWGPQ